MISPNHFLDLLQSRGVDFFTGVPDSLLKHFCACISDKAPKNKHVIAANEGNAIALATGYHLATGKLGLVYMQNSGLGNAANPLISLTDPDVYSIPLLLVIGWRGEPGLKDEPQHKKQGRISEAFLKALEIPYHVISQETKDIDLVVSSVIVQALTLSRPCALLVKKNTFEPYEWASFTNNHTLEREEAVQLVASTLANDTIIVSTTGKISRELFEYRANNGLGHSKDFLTVGSMGHCSQIAMGIAMQKPSRNVYCFDGDGAVIMHMGALALVGTSSLRNYKHVVLNNQCHESVGGQPTVADKINLPDIAKGCGYAHVYRAGTKGEILEALQKMNVEDGPSLLEVLVKPGFRKGLGRPTTTPIENKEAFMNFLRD